jgi:hypothetical protein
MNPGPGSAPMIGDTSIKNMPSPNSATRTAGLRSYIRQRLPISMHRDVVRNALLGKAALMAVDQ